ncbi:MULTISPECIES: biotin--[acetyl-CoA-carboxylase] ligase [Lactobacillus]|uniref:biotin--[biotin carboxyl-carrier protein] ligase n=1 Tax=Lactobacillus xujianguonis TaxID=2495899 RepID=A0A437STV7_9LACO|nr:MULTISPECIES: biotin--[acetyl-CoA-carboxylase] ligase [Lactobacillus]RVU70335.1 biotin--[acetyl-CoA-carboxylase] ligase [Lactobacillus xujianguonis]RVU76878.1 biotin--[acetyl-CoA-carboxylase] ligase [Lactobacillus xujianguonis]
MQEFWLAETPSTQDCAKEYLQVHRENAVFIAEKQTAGYGKQGRSFYSPKDTGIYFSLALPDFNFLESKKSLLTPAIATAIVKVLAAEFPQLPFRIKWVNDLYLHGKKIAGILTEKVANDLVIGVGINLTTSHFPENLRSKAGSITQDQVNRDRLTKELFLAVKSATTHYLDLSFLELYRQKSLLLQQMVTLKLGRQKITGQVVAIDDQGKIGLKNNSGVHYYSSGEVVKVEF